jgi:3',5'-nucleoside bisphosphate phosphatase
LSPAFDLQSHSTCSDGALEPGEVVARAAGAGVELLALSDHDTVAGVSEAIAAGERLGVKVVPAVEISSIDDPAADGDPDPGHAARELHILGYGIDHEDQAFEKTLLEFLADRERRTLRMAQALKDEGLELDEAAIAARVAEGRPIGRPHLAEAVLGASANADRLREEQIDDVGSLIRGYLIEGRPAFRLRETPTVAEAIAAIHGAGGLAVWAHPFWDVQDPDEAVAMVERFKAKGIDGIEVFYITHDRAQTELLYGRCSELGLLSTGSSDFHGPDNRQFHGFLAFETYGLEPDLGRLA